MAVKTQSYYVPAQSPWPIVGAVGLFLLASGAGMWAAGIAGIWGPVVFGAGTLVMTFMLFGWFGNVIDEAHSGLYSEQMDRSFRQGMSWFIFSEVMFFGAFFGALFYARVLAVPWLGGAGNNAMTHEVLWPEFNPVWPLVLTPGGIETTAMGWFGLPLVNTIILLSSSVTVHLAHLALLREQRARLKQWLGGTVLLGALFLGLQAWEYVHAYRDLGLRLDSGIYGNTFFLLTGFHGAHVTLGTLMLFIMWLRVNKGHFTPAQHFGFQASSWYWHFVDVVWLCLFVFVYIL
ncbi:cytochrome c oxidase subunit 3 [Zobellella denitrificans]|jgi:cytochrome c oxidase subunit III|uniref:cytochrome-c oxidase n=1 Tax=Zobellella denitrificans TaxID=347534 RepID=A0A231N1P8_9GAMM|nr:cytochrome c oxidase subunit 3 [Zobellella denitrificans]ATG72575.1 MFS transporter [Zobellella denitrificans]OXS16249.1 cytochrome c oxidase subunit 3 [Zobellella denitrificans]